MLDSLDPRALLSRGYAMVRDAEGAIVPTAARAVAAGHLRLVFADGEVAAVAGEGASPLPPAAPKPAATKPPAAPGRGQGELF